jgi:alkylation response protein AidB-like acyl-CoA dehydrogenase
MGTESAVEVYRMCQEIAGEAALVRAGSPGAFGGGACGDAGAGFGGGGSGGGARGWTAEGELERMNRAAQINTFGGGVSEVQREIVATMRLGMRRGRR